VNAAGWSNGLAGPGLGQGDVRAGSLLAPPAARGPASLRAPALAARGRELLAASGAGYRNAIVTRRGSGCGRGCADGRHRVPAPFAGPVVRRQPARGPGAAGRAVLVTCTGPLLIVPGSRNRLSCEAGISMHRHFLRPVRVRTARSSPRLTFCNTACRERRVPGRGSTAAVRGRTETAPARVHSRGIGWCGAPDIESAPELGQ